GYADVVAAGRVLRRLPGQEALADRRAADYGLRRANAAMHAERREDAVLLALAALPTADVEARRLLAELIGGDLERLRETLRFPSPPARWSVDWDAGEVSVVDGGARARRIPFAAPATDPPAAMRPKARAAGRKRPRRRFASRRCSTRPCSVRSASTSPASPARSGSTSAFATSGPRISCSC